MLIVEGILWRCIVVDASHEMRLPMAALYFGGHGSGGRIVCGSGSLASAVASASSAGAGMVVVGGGWWV